MTRDKGEIRLFELDIFRTLTISTQKAIQKSATLYRLEPNEILYSQGQMSHSLYVVQEGGVRLVRYTPDGKAVTIKIHGKGDLFGLLAISGGFQQHAGVESIGKTEVIGIRGSDVRQLMLQYPEFALLSLDWLVNHIHHAHDRIRSLASERTERRVARALCFFHHKFGVVEDGIYIITIELSQRDIAEFTGTTLESVNRQLRTWKKNDIIQYTRHEISILDYEKLNSIAHSGEDDDVYLDMR